jgi:protease PrsW
MDIIKYFFLTIPLLLALLILLYLKFKFREWSFGLLYKAFIWGLISIIPVILVQYLAINYDLDHLRSLRRIIFYSLVIMGFFSEISKFFFLKVIIYPDKRFLTPVDGIIFSVMVAMGFATANNLLYFIDIPNLTTNTWNIVSAGPANLIFGVLMGFFLGLGKLRKIRFIDSMTAITAAVFFHGLYDFCLLTKDYKLLMAFFIGSAIIVLSLCIVAIRINADARAQQSNI